MCEFCKKKFTTRQALSKHVNHHCKIKNVDYWKNCFKQSEKEKQSLEKDKMNLIKQIEKLLTKVGNNNITTINNNNIQQNNIIIRSFGDENLNYLSNSFFKELISKNSFDSIPNMVKQIHFNNDHPENMNIKIVNKKTPFIDVFKGDKWYKQDKKSTIQKIVTKNFNLLDSKYNEDTIQNELTEDSKDSYENYKDQLQNNKKLVSNIVKNTEKILESK